MKKNLLIILCFFAAFQIHAQNVQWGPVLKVKEGFFYSNQTVNGTYLGQLNGADYYTYYTKRPKGFVIEDTRFAFLEVKGSTITKFTPYSDSKYEYLDVNMVNEQICVFYETGEKKAKRNIKVDYYTPSTLKKSKTINLVSFDPIDKDDPYINVFHSENNKFIGLFANGKNPETGKGTIILKCFNDNLEEVWTSYYDFNGNGYPEIGDMMISNSGNITIHFMKYESDKKKRLESFYFAKISGESISELEYSVTGKPEVIDYKIGEYKENQNLFVYTEEESVNIIKLDFTNQNATNIVSQKPYEGNWKIDKIIDLGNGRYTVAVQNRDMVPIPSRNSNGTVTTTFYYWNRSFLFLGINSENDELIYNKYLGRKYAHMQELPSYELEITIPATYIVKEGDIFVVYNTDKNTEDKTSNKKEKPAIIPGFTMATFKPITKMATISESGDIKVKTLCSSKTDKGTFLTTFCHLDSDGKLVVLKAKSKKVAAGKAKL
jgi:hypothetical protein